jgi:hypothetical protein
MFPTPPAGLVLNGLLAGVVVPCPNNAPGCGCCAGLLLLLPVFPNKLAVRLLIIIITEHIWSVGLITAK